MSFNFDWFSIIKSFLPTIISIFPILFIIGVVILIIYCIKNNVRIKFKTIFTKGFRPIRGDFGLYVYCGSQGSERVKHILLLNI